MVPWQADDFIIVRRTPADSLIGRRPSTFALIGPGLAVGGIPFVTVDEATERGRVIAQNSRVSLWDATGPGQAVLVVTFRRA